MRMLTDRRRLILLAVNALTRAKGYPPSVGDLADAVGLASKAPVHRHLRILCNGGWLSRQPYRDRTVHLGPCVAVSSEGVIATVTPITRCDTCGCDMPADHLCDLLDHPGTDRLLADLKTTAAAADTATAETTPNP